MKLKHINPASLIGRTVIYRHKCWQVKSVNEQERTIKLATWQYGSPGLLRFDQLANTRLYPKFDEAAASYPLLKRALLHACMLTHGEAEGCLVGYLTAGPNFLGSEAVAHIGGAGAAISHAIRCRHNVARQAKQALAVATGQVAALQHQLAIAA